MKKTYIAPQTIVIKAESESVMLQHSVSVSSYNGKEKSKDFTTIHNEYLFSDKGIRLWTGTEQPETSKDNSGWSLWDE